MANMILLKLGTTDVTGWVDRQNFEMDQEDVYDTWTDGNGITHRCIRRTRISGRAKLGFTSATDFTSFQTALAAAKNADGYYSVTAYVNNIGSSETFNAYIDIAASAAKWDWKNSRRWLALTLTITQR